MKYMVIQEMKEPQRENYAKAMEIEKKRVAAREAGEGSPMKMITEMYIPIETPLRSYWVVECEPEDAMKFCNAYGDIQSIKMIPVMSRAEWSKIW